MGLTTGDERHSQSEPLCGGEAGTGLYSAIYWDPKDQGRPVGTAQHRIWPGILGVVMASSELKCPFCALKFLETLSQARKQCLGDKGRHCIYFGVRDTIQMENK